MTNNRNKPTFKSQLLLYTTLLLLLLGIALVTTLSLVSNSVIKDEVPYFYLEPDKADNIIVDESSGTHNPDLTFSETSVQNSIVKRLESKLLRWFILITAGFIVAFLFGMSWISNQISRPITELTEAVSSHDPLKNIDSTSIPKHLESANLQEAVQSKIKELEGLVLQQHEFVLNTAHEFRSPVAAIRMNLDLILQEKETIEPELLESIVSMDNSTIRLQTLLKQYRLYMCNDQIYHPEKIEIKPLVYECIEVLQDKAKNNQVLVSFDTDDLDSIYSDKAILQTILINLIDNAIKYNRTKGNVNIKVSLCQDWYEFSVEDNGIGVSQDDLPYIFDRFYRVDKSRSRKTGGTGLGLAIVKSLVESASGRINIQSEIGKGTIVRLFIPIYDHVAP